MRVTCDIDGLSDALASQLRVSISLNRDGPPQVQTSRDGDAGEVIVDDSEVRVGSNDGLRDNNDGDNDDSDDEYGKSILLVYVLLFFVPLPTYSVVVYPPISAPLEIRFFLEC